MSYVPAQKGYLRIKADVRFENKEQDPGLEDCHGPGIGRAMEAGP
jgi:hypothetical protein